MAVPPPDSTVPVRGVRAGAVGDDAVRTVVGRPLTGVRVELFVPQPEQVQDTVGLIEDIDLVLQHRHPQRSHLIGTACGARVGGLPAGTHHPGLLEPAQCPIHRTGVTVHRMQYP
jgi:hypothetical protein